jgi:hypothetical protein
MKTPHAMISTKLLCLAALALAAPAAHAATTVFSHTFDEGTGGLNGTTVDTGTGSWVAAPSVTANGVFPTSQGSATLAFTPGQGTQYQLDASITGVTGDANWVGFGFANGTSTGTNTGDRFLSQSGVNVEGRAWMFIRGDASASDNMTWTLGSNTTYRQPWSAFANANPGGDIDLRILLDTTGGAGTWTATWFAKRPTDGSYTEVRSSALLPNESITSVGFAFSSDTVDGTLASFSLTQIPEPSSMMLGSLSILALLRRRR